MVILRTYLYQSIEEIPEPAVKLDLAGLGNGGAEAPDDGEDEHDLNNIKNKMMRGF